MEDQLERLQDSHGAQHGQVVLETEVAMLAPQVVHRAGDLKNIVDFKKIIKN
jgi:hypothetical protein